MVVPAEIIGPTAVASDLPHSSRTKWSGAFVYIVNLLRNTPKGTFLAHLPH